MKKIIAILFLAVPASAAYFPPVLLPTGVTASTVAVVNGASALSVSGSTVTVIPTAGGNLPVTGTFWQATQPVSGTFWQATQPVSGTFWQATQPISLTGFPTVPTGVNASSVAVVNGATSLTVQPGNTANTTAWKVDGSAVTQPVSGTFWQATQPVSGTFWQATQPISLTGFPLLPSGVNASTVAVRNDATTFNALVSGSTVTVIPTAGGSLAVIGTLSNNGAAAATNRVGTLPGVAQTSYNNGTAATQGRDVAANIGTDGLLWTTNLPAMRPASYSASTNTITLASTPSDITMLCGNASNTVLVYNLRLSCTQTTAGTVNVTVLKRSTADTSAFSTMTAVAQDSNYAVMASSAVWFTANPTVGTLVGHLDNYKLGCIAPATASPNDIYISPASWRMKPIVLRGTAQCVAVNLQNVTASGGVFTATWEWIETATITP